LTFGIVETSTFARDLQVTLMLISLSPLTTIAIGSHVSHRLNRKFSRPGLKVMSQSQKPTGRKPATKFAHLRKKMEQSKLRANTKMNNLRVRKSGNR
jgi:hypothetical protein